MWLVEHQMNEVFSLEFGQNVINLPLRESAKIVHGNALRIDWEDVVSKDQLNYIIGNPPFVGAKYMSKDNRVDMSIVFEGVKSYGLLDYVSAWYLRAAQYIQDTNIEVGFVSTNSISQGEQTGVLWNEMINEYGIKINFAHRTFQWSNDAKGKAAVHCVIIGFGTHSRNDKYLFDYDEVKGEPQVRKVENINPYLIQGPSILLSNRSKPICPVPSIGIGNKPIDGGLYIFSQQEKMEFIAKEPLSESLFHEFIGAAEFLYNKKRWILLLKDVSPAELRKMPFVLERIEAVRKYRLSSPSKPTIKLADTPTRFHVENFPSSKYLLIPEVTSGKRNYIPLGYIPPEVIASNLVKVSHNATLYHFGILTSSMHMSWIKNVGGRLKSDFRYSVKLIYNNFPWPKDLTDKQKQKVETAAQAVLDTRAKYPDSSLADLYDPLTMPPDLVKAHQALDKAVDRCYRPQPFPSERSRIEYLFQLYEEYTAPLLAATTKKTKKKK
ncbi:UNVERIFIED_CONTAM: hypothetical protein GTU68_066680 [Idotea baltica]|nr:hypothetical protein [Idotea baltica]